MENELFLVYVNPIGQDSKGLYEYEFFFSETPEIVWGEDWNVSCPSACDNLLPDPTTYSKIKTLKTTIPLFCIQENSCFSIQDSIDRLVFLSAEDIREYTEYPTPIRLVFHFADSYKSVIEQFKQRDLEFEKDDNDNITNTIIEDEIDF